MSRATEILTKLEEVKLKSWERTASSPVAPLRGMVKGNTVDKIAASAFDFFDGAMGGLVVDLVTRAKAGGYKRMPAVIFTSTATPAATKQDFLKLKDRIYNSQTDQVIGGIEPIGWFFINDEGAVEELDGVTGTTKITRAFGYQ